MRYFRHTTQGLDIASNTDLSIGHAIVPSEGALNSVVGQVHCIPTAGFNVTISVMYGCDGWLIPMPDPDTVDLVDDVWDRFVEKDFGLASGAVDLDTTTPDIISFDEPGIPQPDRITGVTNMLNDQRFFRRRKILSFASNPTGFDAGDDTYRPADVFSLRARRRMGAEVMSIAVVGFGSPAMSSVTTTHKSTPTEEEWIQIKYMEVVLEQAWMDLIGLTEAGAETPWEEATALIADMLEPLIIEDPATMWGTATFRVFSQLTWDLSVPGRRDLSKALTGAS